MGPESGYLSMNLFKIIVSLSPQGIVFVDDAGTILLVNEALCLMSGYRIDELVGHVVEQLLPEDFQSMHVANRRVYLQSPKNRPMGTVGNLTLRRKDGLQVPIDISLRRVDQDGENGTVAFVIDRREAQEATRLIQHQATHDALTGLANRWLFKQYLDQELSLSRIGSKHLALLVLDLDGFKSVNDSYGHAVGDKLLVDVAHELSAAVRGSDVVARIGGDEFVILLRSVEKLGDAVFIADKLVAALSRERDIEGHPVRTGCSIGVSMYPDHSQDADTLLRCADLAMYHAKEKGKGRSCVFDPQMPAAAAPSRATG